MIPKFRAWDKINREMCTVLAIDYQVEEVLLSDIYDGAWSEFNDIILMQSTGLIDENDEEIYEGDIITDGIVMYLVEFENGMFVGRIEDETEVLVHLIRHYHVCGNKYENPTMIEEWLK